MAKPAPFGNQYGAVLGDRACAMCQRWIWFTSGENGKSIPRTSDGRNHFTNCPGMQKKTPVEKKKQPEQQSLFELGSKYPT